MALHTFPLDGEYVIKVKLLEINLGSIRGLEYEHQLEVTVDGERVLLAPVGGPDDYTQSSLNATNVVNSLAERLQVRVKVKAGQRPVGAAFLMKNAAQGANRLQNFQRSTLIATDHLGLPHVENVTVSGPFNATGVTETPSRRRSSCAVQPRTGGPACASARLDAGCRRVSTASDRRGDGDLMSFYEAAAKKAASRSRSRAGDARRARQPRQFPRIERDPAGAAPGHVSHQRSRTGLAALFFLWSSIPDDELIDVASRGQLGTPAMLEAQTRRMLADPRARALVDNFAGQWLQIRTCATPRRTRTTFPTSTTTSGRRSSVSWISSSAASSPRIAACST
jgi:hypothetical protein